MFQLETQDNQPNPLSGNTRQPVETSGVHPILQGDNIMIDPH